jgi:LacI family transcriptional regulator
MNDERGSEAAVDHFVKLGHRKIGRIAGPPTIDTGRRRLAGFRAAMPQARTAGARQLDHLTDYTEAGGVEAAEALLAYSRTDRPSALYVASFLSGIGAIQVFKEAGLKIPEDLSIVVSDELALAAHTDPPLTTVLMPVARMGEVAARMLLKAVAKEPVTDVVLSEEPQLVVRSSTAPPLKRSQRR